MIGNFQDGTIAGKIQFGSGWWFLDQKEAMEWQLNALSNLGLLSRFVGMVTDSRSFMSYPRHEYFRRVLCNLIGRDIENGEIPDDDSLVGPMIATSATNAKQYMAFPTGRHRWREQTITGTGEVIRKQCTTLSQNCAVRSPLF